MGRAEPSPNLVGSEHADNLVKQYMPLISHIARRYSRFNTDILEDLIQVGAIGLLKAIKYYDPNRAHSASFKTLAACYIKGEIRHYLRDHSSLVRLPRKFNEINMQLALLHESLSKELDRTPTIYELSERSGYSIQQICDAQQSADACTHYESFESVDEHDEQEDSRALAEVVADRKYQDFVLAEEDRERIAGAMKVLSEKTRQIMEFIFFHDLTQKETARKMGVSEMVVSRAVHSSLKKLKDVLATEVV